jgi:hypothetical protein
MDGGGGLSVGGIATVGFTAGMNLPAPAGMQGTHSSPPPGITATASADVVVSISNGAMQALALDAFASVNSSSSAQLSDELTALALLAILERDQQRSLVTAAAAIGAYMAMQAFTG